MKKAGKSKIKRSPSKTKAYLIWWGIASLSAAVYMIRDGKMKWENIHIFEYLDINWWSMDGSWDNKKWYMIRGGRMFNIPTYECFQDIMTSIPTIEYEDKISMQDEFLEYNEEFKTHSRARLIDKKWKKIDVTKMWFDRHDRLKMEKLILERESSLKDMTIEDYFDKHFFTTNFWYMWQTTFAFQKRSSLAELRRYMIRFIHEFPRIHTLEWVARSQFNQYDSIILPIQTWLKEKWVNFHMKTQVLDLEFNEKSTWDKFVSKITYKNWIRKKYIDVLETDIVTFTNWSITDNSTEWNTKTVAKLNEAIPPSFTLWDKIAEARPEFWTPSRFYSDIKKSMWYSFTVTINNNPKLLDYIQKYTRNHPWWGWLVTFRDSNWLLSIVVARQPHFKNQPNETQIFWWYSLYPDKKGDYIKKSMIECTWAEIIEELLYHLNAIEYKKDFMRNLICRTCIMPYIDSLFMPRLPSDRPLIIPKWYENFAFISQFAESPEDVVFTVEYSVRCAQRAVYYLLWVDKPLTKMHHHALSPKVLLASFLKLHS